MKSFNKARDRTARFRPFLTIAATWLLVVAVVVSEAVRTDQEPALEGLPGTTLTVFAASDLVVAFQRLIPAFERAYRTKVILVPGSTGTLAQQIRHGAPADLYFAANESFVDDLARAGLILPDTRTLYAQGRIVLVTGRVAGLPVTRLEDLCQPAVRRVAIANPAHAPYGLAAQEALQAVGLWTALKPKLVYAENVRQALQFVQTGAAEAGIVARSVADDPRLAWTPIDPSQHAPLNQAAAVLRRTRQPDLARAFLRFVNGPQGGPVMKSFGFLLPGEF